jgi:phosphoribosylformylglycinamidine synthase
VAEIQAVCARWELGATPIGRVTDDGVFRVVHEGRVVAAIPGQPLVDDCPVYQPEAREDDEARMRRSARPARPPVSPEEALRRLLDAPSIASKRWVYEQYDSTVQAATVLGPGGDAGVLEVAGTGFGLALTVDCNPRLVALDPCEGGKAAVAEAARNIACTGAIPLGVTDCLNFGNPEKPDVFFQFREACRGISEACRAFETPVTGGNVSFYNESPTGAVDPTPTIGMVGLLPRIEDRVPSHFRQPGDAIVVLGATRGELGGSAYWAEVLEFTGGQPARVDLGAERRLQQFLAAAARARLLRSAHDLSEGGLAVAAAEAAVGGPYAARGLGASLDLAAYGSSLPDEALLYGEDGARVVVSCSPTAAPDLIALAAEHGVPAARVGAVGDPGGRLELRTGSRVFSWVIDDLRRIYYDAIPRRMAHADLEDRAAES